MADPFESLRARLRQAFGNPEGSSKTIHRVLSVGLDNFMATAGTRHFRDGVLLGKPAALSIAQIEGCDGFYLLYLDRDGKEMTDTFHETLDQAFDQAAMEFGVSPSDWREE